MAVQTEMAKPADLAGEFLSGVRTAGQIRAEQQRLQQEQQQEAQRLQMASQQASARLQQVQQEHDIQQQRIQVSAASNKQRADLEKQRLGQAAQVNAQKTQAAARQFQNRQKWDKGLGDIDQAVASGKMTKEQGDAAKSQFIMRRAPGLVPGTAVAPMLHEMLPPKPNIPAKIEDKGDFMQVTQPNGMVQLHPKPRAPTQHDPSVKVTLEEGSPPVTMSRSQALQVIPSLPPELQTNAVNKAVLTNKTPGAQGKPSAPKAGDVYKGHKFLGGNPSQKENWEKVEDESTQE